MKGWRRNYEDNPGRGDKIRFDRRVLKILKHVKTWQLLVVLVVFVMLAAIFLRLNNIGMMERREALIEADKTGNIIKVQNAARELQNYVARHMNTTTGRVALQTLYDQDFNKVVEENKQPDVENGDYQAAMVKCRQSYPRGGQNWAKCVADSIGVSEYEITTSPLPSPDTYYISYASVRWSSDLAGVSVMICALLIITVILRAVFVLVLKIVLKFKYRATE